MAYEVDSSIYNYGDPIGSFYQGYQLAQIPKEIKKKNEIDLLNKSLLENQAKYAPLQSEENLRSSQLKNEGMATQNAYAPQLSEEELKNAKLKNEGLKTSNDVDALKFKIAKEDQDKKAILLSYLYGAGNQPQYQNNQQDNSGQQQPQNYQGNQWQNLAQPQLSSPKNILMQSANNGMQQQPDPNQQLINAQQAIQQQAFQGGQYPQRTIEGAGNPSNVSQILQRADQIWASNEPGARKFLKEQGYEGSTKSYQYQGQVIDETTLPSGRKTYSVTRVAQPQEGTTVYDPSTGNPIVTLGGSGGMLGLPKPKAGEGYYYKTDENGKFALDNNGNPIPEGVLKPYTEKEREELTGRVMFSQLYPKVNEIQSYYSGKGSYEKYLNDVKAVEQDPENNSEARERLIQLEESKKLLSPLTAKEIATLNASNTYGMYRALVSQLQSTDLPKFLNTYASFKVPSYVKKEAGERFLDDISQATKTANSRVPAYQKMPFDVDKSSDKKSDALIAASNNKNSSDKINWGDYEITKDEGVTNGY